MNWLVWNLISYRRVDRFRALNTKLFRRIFGHTECGGAMVNFSASYTEGHWFKSRFGGWITSLWFSCFSSAPPGGFWDGP
jgi:hypothetical protein